jgi:hypothetical protein
MKEWIKKEIAPPGMEKKRRGSLYSLIGRVFGVAKTDAEKSFNAFFPYLCDPEILRKHGAALSVPELPYDTEEEYRNRVSSAAFYLMRAGERGYINAQLSAHFEDRFTVEEEFLRVRVKIFDITKKDRMWARSFLDGTLDPNILLDLAELFDVKDAFPKVKSRAGLIIRPKLYDLFNRPLEYNGAINYDGETINGTVWVDSEYDGECDYDGQMSYDGAREVVPNYEIRTDFTYSDGNLDTVGIAARFDSCEDAVEPEDSVGSITARFSGARDAIEADDSANIAARFNGLKNTVEPEDSLGMALKNHAEDSFEAADSFTIGIRYEHEYDGSCEYDGLMDFDSMELNALGG